MFQEMGEIPQELFEPFWVQSRQKTERMLESGEYIGWFATPDNNETILAGAGVQLREVMPHPAKNPNGEVAIAAGRHAIILNVFTEPEWRKRGLAALLIKTIIEWSRENHIDRLLLHAARDARLLYQRLGFQVTNEMKFVAKFSSSSAS